VRIWVPACATGEEAYSIAILFLEQFAAARKPANFQIFASDIDEESLEVARRGVYPASAIAELSPERIAEFFIKTDENHYQVTKQLRAALVITRQNLISDAPFSRLDLISCRNLLIYLEPELQQKVLSMFHFALNERGALFLGCSESIGRQTDLFESLSKPWRLFRRIGSVRQDLVQIPIMGGEEHRFRVPRSAPLSRPRMGVSELLQKLLLTRFAPAAALINRKYEVQSLSGKTSDYLELPDGELTRDLLSLVRPGLRTKIRSACQKVLLGGEPMATVEARVRRNGDSVACAITVGRVDDPKEAQGLLLVTFRDHAEQPPLTVVTDEESTVVRQLEDEVESTREDLQSTIEELQSSNEEVMSMNEELQSANEELETSKEELQSFNEELSTVNSQLQAKIDELEQANNDIRNLLISTEIATVFLDTDLRIRRFTPATAQLLHLLETDIGRPIRDFALRFTDQTLLRDAGRVLDQLTSVETEIRSEEGRWFLRRILPYHTADNHIEGVAITFVDITARMQAEAQSRRLAAVLRDSSDAILLLDFIGRITSWNRGAERLYGYTEAEALKLMIGDLVPADERAPQEQLIQAVARGEELESFEARGITKDGRLMDVWSTITPLTDTRGHLTEVAMTSRDITDRKRSELALAASERRLRAILDTAADAIVTIDEQSVIEGFNPAAERMFGYSRDEAIGQNVKILLPNPSRELSDEDLSINRDTSRLWEAGIGREFVGQRRDGSAFPLELAVSELQDGARKYFTALIRDISERKALQRELLSIAAEEQRRIGQDLHDSVGQKLTGLSMLAGSLGRTLSERSPTDEKAADRIANGLKGVLEQIRSLSKGLIGVEVDPEGLSAALAELAETTSHESGIPCEFDCPALVLVENNEIATQLYRIAQEAVTNALKHGAPRHVRISLRRKSSQLALSIRDDGKGISPDAWQAQGMGLKIMQHRAELIGATLSVVPVKKAGSLVTCRLFENRNHGKSHQSTD
jgi:two-component system CheB/CheR fusion protein